MSGDLTVDQVLEALNVKEGEVHSFMNPGPGILVGCDHRLASVLELVREHGAKVAGEMAQSMKHGIAIMLPDHTLFMATREGWKPPAGEP